MELATILYSFFLVILLTASGTLAYLYHYKSKSSFFIVLGIMFSVNIIAYIIIYMTEMVGWFSDFYNSQFMTIPSLKTVFILCNSACMIFLITSAVGRKITLAHISVVIFHALAIMFIPMLPDSAWQVWFYYLPSQLVQIGLSLYGLRVLKKKDDKSQVQNVLCKLMIITIIFSVFILLEDSIIIFKYDVYSDATLRIHNRNICEDILSIIYSIFSIRHCILFLFCDEEKKEIKVSECENNIPAGIKEDFCLTFELTSREKDVLFLLIGNKNNQDICNTLNISIGTVKAHIHNIYNKVDVSKREQLIRKYETYPSGNEKYSKLFSEEKV